jgi:hypothetical protein
MEKLAHLTAFVSLIYGLGVANVLAHVSSLIKRRQVSAWYWVHALWTVQLLVMMAGLWWLLQNWAPVARIGFLSYLSLLIAPSLLFVASDLLFPERTPDGGANLREHFFRIKKPFFVVMLGLLVSDELDSLLKGWDHVITLGPFYWGSQLFFYLAIVTGFRSDRDRIQGVVVCLFAIVFVVGMINALAAV